MGKKFIADGAPCMCKFGSAPGRLKVVSHQLIRINHSDKKIATSTELGNPFYPPAFGVCKASWPSRPCVPAIVKWDHVYDHMRINRCSHPLLPESKGTCAACGTPCIDILDHGQIEELGRLQLRNASMEHQHDLNPVGEIKEEKYDITVQLI